MWRLKKINKILLFLICCLFFCLKTVSFAASDKETATPEITGDNSTKTYKINSLPKPTGETDTTQDTSQAPGPASSDTSQKVSAEDTSKEAPKGSIKESMAKKEAPFETEKPREIIFVLDNSGSMIKNDPNRITKEVVIGFIKNLKSSSRIGMVIFDTQAKVLKPLAQISGDMMNAEFIESLNYLDYKGQQTNTPMGIERALYELKTNGEPDVDKMIILLTDGIIDTGDRLKDAESERWLREDLVSQCSQLGIRIYGIAFTDQADFRLMQMLASKTNGEYFRVYQPEGIQTVFDAINKQLDEASSAPTATVIKEADETKPTGSPSTASSPLSSSQKKDQVKSGQEPAEPKLPTLRTEPIQPVQTTPSPVSSPKNLWDTLLTLFLIAVIIFVLVLLIIMLKSSPAKVGGAVRTSGANRPLSESQPEVQAELIDVEHIIPQDSISLTIDKASVSIGRDTHNDIVIPEKVVSSLHATITYRNGQYYLEDNRSTNGTRLNNQVIEQNTKVKLKSGDIIHFAKCEFRFLVHDQAPYGETMLIEAD